MIKNSVFLLSLFALLRLDAQTSLSGIVNTYGQLITQDECLNTIEVDDPSSFSEGMAILVFQTNGADIDLSNGESFGDITSLNGAGLYEYNRILAINGASLSLEYHLQNTYSPNSTQVIGVPIYSDIIVDDTVIASAWDGVKGGLVVMEAENTIELQANVDVTGMGYRSGQPYVATDDDCGFLTFSNNFSYGSGNWRGAPKGEGVAAIVNGAENGRGAQANGGGGGNSHNSGGGGGALYAEGGRGGTNDEPGAFNCRGSFAGRGGKPLINDPARLFFGGAGGNGHTNNSEESLGGKGGGIIILIAAEVVFNGGRLIADGQDGQAPPSGDGSAGGGAAGSILINAPIVTGAVDIAARGGNGGDVNNGNLNRCFGPGGGGSGGFVAANQALSAQLDGGIPGISQNSTACNSNNGAATGGTGMLNTNFTTLVQGSPFILPEVTTVSNDTIVCEGASLQLMALTVGEGLQLQWQYLDNGNWMNLAEENGYSGTQTNILTFEAADLTAGAYRLRLGLDSECFMDFNSDTIDVSVEQFPTLAPQWNIDGFDVDFMANADHFNSIQWTFLEGENSIELNPSFTFPAPGEYEVVVQATNDCGVLADTIIIEIAAPLLAQFSSTANSGCAPLSILFSDESIGEVLERNWSFEGGDPATSTMANPLVQFLEPGDFEVTLTIQNGGSSNTSTSFITVFDAPAPSFSFETDELSVVFNNTSTNASNYVWNFGDDETSTSLSPMHTYSTPGTYEVSLNAFNDFCGTEIVQSVSVTITDVDAINDDEFLRLFPNPSKGYFYLEGLTSGDIQLFDLSGRAQIHQTIHASITLIDLRKMPDGLYVLVVKSDQHTFVRRLIKG